MRNQSPDMKKSAPRISQGTRQSALDNYPSPLRRGVNPRERHTSPDAVSQGNVTFLSGTGVFDWAQSKLMNDVLDGRQKFNIEDSSIYTEEDVYNKIEQVKTNPKSIREPEHL